MKQQPDSLRKNPSRETCETIIRRILMTEVLQEGKNHHFRQATDFMSYFESLYPPSESLTKQVQRAVKAMDLPRDGEGYFIVNKSKEQVEQDDQLKRAFSLAKASAVNLENYIPVFLAAPPSLCPYLKEMLLNSITFRDKILTIAETSNGLLLYTDQPAQVEQLLRSLYC